MMLFVRIGLWLVAGFAGWLTTIALQAAFGPSAAFAAPGATVSILILVWAYTALGPELEHST